MPPPSEPELDLLALQKYFAGRLPARLAELEEAWRAVAESGWEAEPARTLHRLAHSLNGAGSTFGFPEVSRAARALERFLKEVLDNPAFDGAGPAGEEASGQAAKLLEEVRRAAPAPDLPAGLCYPRAR